LAQYQTRQPVSGIEKKGRYKAILVQKEAYLLELSRYIVLNPVRARMVRTALDWPWSNYQATAGMIFAPDWLETDWILTVFAKRKQNAQNAYRQFVGEGKGQPSPWEGLKNQIYLGSEAFVEEMQRKVDGDQRLSEIRKTQRRPVAHPLTWYFMKHKDRDTAIFEALRSGGYSMREIGDHVGLHYSRISRIISLTEKARDMTPFSANRAFFGFRDKFDTGKGLTGLGRGPGNFCCRPTRTLCMPAQPVQ
jgi:hypothetical protein